MRAPNSARVFPRRAYGGAWAGEILWGRFDAQLFPWGCSRIRQKPREPLNVGFRSVIDCLALLLNMDDHVGPGNPGARQLNRSQARRRPVGNSEVDLVPIHSSWVSDGGKNLSRFSVYPQLDWRIDNLERIRCEGLSWIGTGPRRTEA